MLRTEALQRAGNASVICFENRFGLGTIETPIECFAQVARFCFRKSLAVLRRFGAPCLAAQASESLGLGALTRKCRNIL